MTKLAEIKDASELSSKIKYVNQVWASWRETRLQTLQRMTNYLFVLNSGALLAALTYVAAKPANPSIQISIWLFSAGIFLVLRMPRWIIMFRRVSLPSIKKM